MSVPALQTAAQGLLDYAQTITGEDLMFIMDVPYVPAQDTPIVLAQAAVSSAGGTTPLADTSQPDYLMKICKNAPSADGTMSALNAVDPATSLVIELENMGHKYADFTAAVASVKFTMTEGTAHGKLNAYTDNGIVYYMYESEPGYVGKDRVVFMAEFDGKRYKIVINIIVSVIVGENPPVCPPPKIIKVNKPALGISSLDFGSISVAIADLPSPRRAEKRNTFRRMKNSTQSGGEVFPFGG